jgi:hypothetical protein
MIRKASLYVFSYNPHTCTFDCNSATEKIKKNNRFKVKKLKLALAGRRGIVFIESAYRTEDNGFESRQGVRFLGI